MALLEIENLSIEFAQPARATRVVDNLSLRVNAGETVCLLGESGCGKSVTALSIARLLPEPPARYPQGRITLDGIDMLQASPEVLRSARGSLVSYIFQEPSAYLNPVTRVGNQILETLRAHQPDKATEAEAIRLLRQVRIPDPALRAREYPFRLSGGMQQRVMLALALASRPKLLVADEPTTALDVTIQAEILDLLRQLQAEHGLGVLFITHNLGIVGQVAHRVAVMYAGQIVEAAATGELLEKPLHPYTRGLMAAAPRLGSPKPRLEALPGAVPTAGVHPPGCRLAPRCASRQTVCERPPELIEARPDHWVRCPVCINSAVAAQEHGVA